MTGASLSPKMRLRHLLAPLLFLWECNTINKRGGCFVTLAHSFQKPSSLPRAEFLHGPRRWMKGKFICWGIFPIMYPLRADESPCKTGSKRRRRTALWKCADSNWLNLLCKLARTGLSGGSSGGFGSHPRPFWRMGRLMGRAKPVVVAFSNNWIPQLQSQQRGFDLRLIPYHPHHI